jgi:hypothetical protein
MARMRFQFDGQIYKIIKDKSNIILKELSSIAEFRGAVQCAIASATGGNKSVSDECKEFIVGDVVFSLEYFNNKPVSARIYFGDESIAYRKCIFYQNNVRCINVNFNFKYMRLYNPVASAPCSENSLEVYEAIQALLCYVRYVLSA